MARAKLGEILIQQGVIDEATLKRALGEQIRFVSQRMRIGQILVDMRVCTLTQVSQALSTQLNVPYAALDALEPQVAALLPHDLCERYQALPFGMESSWPEVVRVAFVDPMNPTSTEDVQKRLGKRIKIFIASPDVLKRKVAEAFGLAPPPAPQSTAVAPLELGSVSSGDAPMELEPVAIGGLTDPNFVSAPDEVTPVRPPVAAPALPPASATPEGPPVLQRSATPLPMGELMADDAVDDPGARSLPRTARDAFEELFGPANTHLGSHDGHDDPTPASGVTAPMPAADPLRLTDLLPPPKVQTPLAQVHTFEDKRPKKVKPPPAPATKPTLVLTTAALLGPDPSEVTVSELPTLTGEPQGDVLTGEVVADEPETPPGRDPLEHLLSTGNTGPQAVVTPTAPPKPPETPATSAVTPPMQPVVAPAPVTPPPVAAEALAPMITAPVAAEPAPVVAAEPVVAPPEPAAPSLSLDDAWGSAFDAPAPRKVDPPKAKPKPAEPEVVDEVALDVELDTTDEKPPEPVAEAKPEAKPEPKPEVKPEPRPAEAFGEDAPSNRKFTGEFEIDPDLDVDLGGPVVKSEPEPVVEAVPEPVKPPEPAPAAEAVAAPVAPPPAETPAADPLAEKAWSIELTPARGSAAVVAAVATVATAEVILDAEPVVEAEPVVDAMPLEVPLEVSPVEAVGLEVAPPSKPAAPQPSSDTGAFVVAVEMEPEAEPILDLTPENEVPPPTTPSPSSLSGSFERLIDRQLTEEEMAIVKAIDALADGTIQDSPIAAVKPAQMVAALVRLLIRKGIVSELDYLVELSRK